MHPYVSMTAYMGNLTPWEPYLLQESSREAADARSSYPFFSILRYHSMFSCKYGSRGAAMWSVQVFLPGKVKSAERLQQCHRKKHM